MTGIKELLMRRKIAWANPEALFGYFGNWKHQEYVEIREFQECEGAEVVSVFYDPIRHQFGVELVREDWPEVPRGELPPDLNGHVAKVGKLGSRV